MSEKLSHYVLYQFSSNFSKPYQADNIIYSSSLCIAAYSTGTGEVMYETSFEIVLLCCQLHLTII